ncbi:MAG: hypothetical protein QM756_07210 [Polyangiaceae bacterium]
MACASEAASNGSSSGGATGSGGSGAGGANTAGGASGGSVTSGGAASGGAASGGTASGGASTATGGAVTGGASASGGAAGSNVTGGAASGGGSQGGATQQSGGAGGRSAPSSDPSTFGLGSPSRCGAGFAVCEDFESTAVGALPSGWTTRLAGTRTLGAADDDKARGNRSLRIDVAGAQGYVTAWLERSNLGALANAHFGRLFYKIKGPGPTEFVHFDLFAGTGPYAGHTNEVRWASTGTVAGTGQGNWSWIYNVQPSGSGAGGEFGSEGDRSAHPVVDRWTCLEWSFSASPSEARFWNDGSEVTYLHIDTERSEVPVFDKLAVGFAKYQNTGAFQVWIDEVVFDPARIGCNN